MKTDIFIWSRQKNLSLEPLSQCSLAPNPADKSIQGDLGMSVAQRPRLPSSNDDAISYRGQGKVLLLLEKI